MTRAVIVFANEEKKEILFMPDGQRIEPSWENIALKYSADLTHFELIDNDDPLQRVVGIVFNLRLILRFLDAGAFYVGWLNNHGMIDQKPITIHMDKLLP